MQIFYYKFTVIIDCEESGRVKTHVGHPKADKTLNCALLTVCLL